MEKTTQRFQRIATALADLNAEGLNAQSVNDLLTMYVGAASQHVLRMSFVPEQEAHNFYRQVTTFWSHLIQRDVTSPFFFLPLKLGGLGVGSAVQRHAAATRSVNLERQPSKIQVWRGSCQDLIPPELQDKVKLTLSCLGGHLQIYGDVGSSPIVLGEQTSMEKTRLNAEGLNAQTVNDLLTMHVGATSQHVLRMSLETWCVGRVVP